MKSDLAKIKDNFDKYIVRPANLLGFGGFVFDVEGESVVNLQNEITDHFVEDNTSIQDQIAVKPKRITLKNYVGEIADIVEDRDNGTVQKLTRKLTVLNGLLPELSDASAQAQDSIRGLITEGENIGDIDILDIEVPDFNKVVDLYAVARNFGRPQSKLEQAYQYFKALRDQKILISVQTPFEFMPNMAIETISARQGEETRTVSDFSITLKEIRFAGVEFTELSAQGRRAAQQSAVDNRSNIEGQNADVSLLKQGLGNLSGIFTGDAP